MPKRETLSRILFLIGGTYIIFYAALLLIHTVALFSRLGLTNAGTILATGLTLGFFVWAGRRVYHLSYSQFLIALLVMLLLAVLSGIIAGYFLDLSWDGRDYQQKAIRELASGWNPIYITIQPEDIYRSAWLNHYPKGPWLSAASIYMLAKDIEYGKTFNQLLIWAVFFIGSAYFLTYPQLQPWKVFLISFFLAVNPVSTSQFLSYYVDGQVSSMIILLILILLLALRRDDSVLRLTLVAAIIVALNVKFTGTAYSLMVLFVFFPLSWYVKRSFSTLRSVWMAIVVGALLGGLLVGYNPYVSNMLRNGHPFYPIFGSSQFNHEFVIREQAPPDFREMSRLEKLGLSVFSRSQISIGTDNVHPKNPLSVQRSEIAAFVWPDVRLGGWGPLFGALVLLSAISILILAIAARQAGLAVIGFTGAILAITLVNTEPWWARYSPQLWLIPIGVLVGLWVTNKKGLEAAGFLIAALMLVNMALVAGPYLAINYKENREVRSTMEKLAQSGESIDLYYGSFEAAGMRLKEKGIAYRWVEHLEELPCPVKLEPWVYYSPSGCTP